MTTWGSYIAPISMLLNYIAAQDQRSHPGEVSGTQFFIWRVTIWFTPLSLSFHILITLAYWLVIRDSMEEASMPDIYSIVIHIQPLVLTFIEFIMQLWLFRRQQFSITLGLGIIYAFVNYIGSKILGHPIYAVIRWDHFWTSVAICAGVSLILMFTFEGYVKLADMINRKKLKGYYCSQDHMVWNDQDQYKALNLNQAQMRLVYIPVTQV